VGQRQPHQYSIGFSESSSLAPFFGKLNSATTSSLHSISVPISLQPVVVCDHRAELDRLIHHLESIDRHLSIITRAMMLGGAR
jgi:hypothetical protein